MLNNNTINGVSIYTISTQFIEKISEPGVKAMGDDFFVVHDCIHWFTNLGVSELEERVIGEIQTHMYGTTEKPLSKEAEVAILFLKEQDVYNSLKDALLEAKANFDLMFKGLL